MPRETCSAIGLARELGVDLGSVILWGPPAAPQPGARAKQRQRVGLRASSSAGLVARACKNGGRRRQPGPRSQHVVRAHPRAPQVELELVELRHAELISGVLRVEDVLEIVGADCDSMRRFLRSAPARLATLIRGTPCLQDEVAEPKSRDGGNRVRKNASRAVELLCVVGSSQAFGSFYSASGLMGQVCISHLINL